MVVVSSAGFSADVVARDAEGNITGARFAPKSVMADFIISLHASVYHKE